MTTTRRRHRVTLSRAARLELIGALSCSRARRHGVHPLALQEAIRLTAKDRLLTLVTVEHDGAPPALACSWEHGGAW